MPNRVVPMIHVPDVRATADWYQDIGFEILETYGNDSGGLSFAILAFGNTQVMFSQGGKLRDEKRRDVDLYAYTDHVDDLYSTLKDRVNVEAQPHNTFYGMREFIIRDINGFWITFAEPSVFGKMMNAIHNGNAESVRNVLTVHDVKADILNHALAVALASDSSNNEIIGILENAGAARPITIEPNLLKSYAGEYKGSTGFDIHVTFKDDKLFAAQEQQSPMTLTPLDQSTFRPLALDDYGTITFLSEQGQITACELRHGKHSTKLVRQA